VALLKSFACRLAQTKFGQKSLTKPDGLHILRQKPCARVYAGLVLLAMSCLISLPTLALLGYLSVNMSKPIIIAVGGPVVFILVHIMFGLGVYLAGQNYAVEFLHWATKRFLEKYA